MMPYLVIASIAYSEQVGINLQLMGNRGETRYRYSRIRKIKIFFIEYFSVSLKIFLLHPGIQSHFKEPISDVSSFC